MRPDGTEPMTPLDLRPGDVVVGNFRGVLIRITKVEPGRWGILVSGQRINEWDLDNDKRWLYYAYALLELPPPPEPIDYWRGFRKLSALTIQQRKWAVIALARSDPRPRIPATYDAILDEWRMRQATSGVLPE